jgi:hypothetical protein
MTMCYEEPGKRFSIDWMFAVILGGAHTGNLLHLICNLQYLEYKLDICPCQYIFEDLLFLNYIQRHK